MNLDTTLFNLLESQYEKMVEIRRYLHKYPELSFHEIETANYIKKFYDNSGIPHRDNVGGNGVVATVTGKRPGKTIALRADFDALPIQDEKNVSYKSKHNGVMHACGHDAHTATLLILAKSIDKIKHNLSGKYVFIHQHAEESHPGGAISMIKDGCLDGVDEIYGTHLWSTTDINVIETVPYAFMASSDRFTIDVLGKGGHGGLPEDSKDAISISVQLINQLQYIVSRRISPLDPAVLTIGEINAGKAPNVIAENSIIKGTVRTFDKQTRQTVEKEMKEVCKYIAMMNDCQIKIDYKKGYPPLINHKENFEIIKYVTENIPGLSFIESHPYMAGEDFSYYLENKPGAFFFTGAKNLEGDVYPHHHPLFDINEKAMLNASKVLGKIAINRARN